jgi:hypothetical protein
MALNVSEKRIATLIYLASDDENKIDTVIAIQY